MVITVAPELTSLILMSRFRCQNVEMNGITHADQNVCTCVGSFANVDNPLE